MEKSLLLSKSYGRSVLWLCAVLLAFCSTFLHAQQALLSAEEAFPVQVESVTAQEVQLHWDIPEHYYLYQHKFEVRQGQHVLPLKLPKAEDLHDDNYGQTQVYYQQVQFNVPTQASQTYQVTWQGCAKDRICYPPQTIEFKTDADGLVALQNQFTAPKRLLDLNSNNNSATVENTDALDQTNATSASQTAQDQRWSTQLAQRSPIYGLLLFLGLGILLAFTPCSLPMIPILSSLIVRDRRGVKAWMIALVFVCSMAMVYAVLGLVASSAGLNFQRWLQQPSTLIAFSLLFVVFALNLFGLFELRLPHAVVHRLDHWQSMQKGGSLIGAAVMGMISALLVGPCMTAPLAGALLFISQTQNQWQGALLLFTLGFGMGLPLLLASILGAKALPKAGLWMNQIKVLFAFLMLALALYFIRPLLSESWMQGLSLLLGLSFIGYALYRALWQQSPLRPLYLVILLLVVPYVFYSQYQQSQRFFVEQGQQQMQWHVAQTAAEFQQILAQAPKDRAIVIDVYADWCVACQPIEHRILKSAQVQQALSPYTLIKLDLSHYDASHQQLLNQWDILGPPTYLFLTPQQQEVRGLRLTGAFSEAELLQQLKQFGQDLGP
ncbi:protein-disulfide reductase DsbD [Acinetobacter tandoii]|uniref:Thiol:disulfide interchange protein DsbD n=1 Tax=Acinetobacter tandoii DSM 14970 = CIP 107469 TaxID=1120927 RepID=R9AK84_9GAMM|nr:protein-disulfide reductase DsbD [Acinetobacter tandoii]EOR02612.1 thiol:disulfide interchange protein DsbD [Acinetobacter tandoii DSM 14970 = CIP 107469]